jgi:hypothetical protein
VPITQKEQVQARRNRIWQLYSQGLSQRDIVKDIKDRDGVEVSQKTVCNDLIELRKDAENFVRDHRKHIAEEYSKVMCNLEQLRAEAWKQFRMIENKDSSVKVALYDTIQSINNNILILLSVGDAIEMELKVNDVSENAKEIRKEMDNLKIEQNSIKRQAKF